MENKVILSNNCILSTINFDNCAPGYVNVALLTSPCASETRDALTPICIKRAELESYLIDLLSYVHNEKRRDVYIPEH